MGFVTGKVSLEDETCGNRDQRRGGSEGSRARAGLLLTPSKNSLLLHGQESGRGKGVSYLPALMMDGLRRTLYSSVKMGVGRVKEPPC